MSTSLKPTSNAAEDLVAAADKAMEDDKIDADEVAVIVGKAEKAVGALAQLIKG
ncbi:MAG: hypothetical protein SA339_10230 [Methanomassiliicoccus sp.]|nr:hypothetical protein [Methanomassiliicoccus sp.]